ncbi:tyrosine-type recombinase/integrase [Spirillospora sp. NBC_01491]|uniref:tyrosine-type recombinase/integrase n=1 Tax=Spirillospora sp. NBC_01491 TaxID=2976007 RepID=UPI002E33F188|nr:site-specific integrase [Spirillospora sp. NBC_01491]
MYREGAGWTGAIALGRGQDGRRRRLKRKALTQAAVMDKLIDAVADLEKGIQADRNYTVERAFNNLLKALASRGRSAATVQTYRQLATGHLLPQLGQARVQDLTADDVERWLFGRAEQLSTSTLGIVHGLLTRALRRAQRHDKLARNVSELVDTPRGRTGRRSRSMSAAQATALLRQAREGGHRLGPYVTLGLLTGLRTEELRALRWDQVDLQAGTIVVTRSARSNGDTKTPGSRRGLRLCALAVEALQATQSQQAADRLTAGPAYANRGLVFGWPDGTAWTAGHVRYRFQKMTAAAGLGTEWCPRELRHTFVSLMSDDGVRVEKISDLVGHRNSVVTQTVYRHQLRPVIEAGAERMQHIFANVTATSA